MIFFFSWREFKSQSNMFCLRAWMKLKQPCLHQWRRDARRPCWIFLNYAAEMSKEIAEYKYILTISRTEHTHSFFRFLWSLKENWAFFPDLTLRNMERFIVEIQISVEWTMGENVCRKKRQKKQYQSKAEEHNILITKNMVNVSQRGKHQGMHCLQQDQKAWDLMGPQHDYT